MTIMYFIMMKVLITGGSGLLGSALSLYFKDYFETVSTYTKHKINIDECETIYLDITDAKNTAHIIENIRPQIIIHTAALVGVNYCEKEPELAFKINVEGTRNIVEAAKKTNSKIIYVSTDYIFDGKQGRYSEKDDPNPISYYGTTKLEGEKAIDTNNDAIIRTSIYGWNIVKERQSFSTWVVNELSSNRQINIFTDQYNSMMLANNCAEALKEIIDKNLNGILNIASSARISRYNFAVKIADVFNLDHRLISPVKNNEVSGHEKRPQDVSLDISKAKKILRTKLLNVNESLLMLKKLRENGYLNNFKVM